MPTMKAELRQVLGKPARLNKDGEVLTEEYAAINLNVRLDSRLQHKAVAMLQNMLSNPKVVITIEPEQARLDDPLTEEEVDEVVDGEPLPIELETAGITSAE